MKKFIFTRIFFFRFKVCEMIQYLMVRSFGREMPGTRNVYIGMSVENTGNKNVNITRFNLTLHYNIDI